MIIPVILSGGSGTRLWPLSTPEKPKQFLPLVTDRTMFQETLLRLKGLPGLADPIIVCNEMHRFLVAEQLREIDATAQAIVLEPEGRNTAPAIGIAALLANAESTVNTGTKDGSGPTLLVLPADHVIADTAAFQAAVSSAVVAAENGRLVTFGIVPTHPETGYGYIEQGADEGYWSGVKQFVEKPDRATAEQYLAAGTYFWNSGMFAFSARSFLNELQQFNPDIVAACMRAVAEADSGGEFTRLGSSFLESPSDSIDYAVMERTSRAAVVPLDAGWNDIGSWSALFDVAEKGDQGSIERGDVVSVGGARNLVWSNARVVAAVGLEDIIVIETADEVLVLSRKNAQDIKKVVERMRTNP